MLIPISYKLCFLFSYFHIWMQTQNNPVNRITDALVLFCTCMLLCTICSLEASLRFKLASETSKAASQWDRIQQLQNDLIKVGKCLFTNYIVHFCVHVVYCISLCVVQKNDSKKELLQLRQRVRRQRQQQQQQDLQHHQGCLTKMATLEATVKQQEKVRSAFHMFLQQGNGFFMNIHVPSSFSRSLRGCRKH